ncbi:MAG: DUF1127 domain-containing protein [Azospirillum sp.]|nr:DUF1127 domain-containing protein [Azospirillum sp.]
MQTIVTISRLAGGALWSRTWRESTALLDRLQEWHDRARERAMLRGLDDGVLKDLGISRADAELESDKPFWRG